MVYPTNALFGDTIHENHRKHSLDRRKTRDDASLHIFTADIAAYVLDLSRKASEVKYVSVVIVNVSLGFILHQAVTSLCTAGLIYFRDPRWRPRVPPCARAVTFTRMEYVTGAGAEAAWSPRFCSARRLEKARLRGEWK